MKNFKGQKESGQCGIYNLANVLKDKSILKYADIAEYIPCGTHESNKILKAAGYDIQLSALIASVNYKLKIPTKFFINSINAVINQFDGNDEEIVIFIIYAQCGNGKKGLHAVSLIYWNNRYYYTDPNNDSFIEISSIKDIFKHFKYANSLICITNQNGDFVALKSYLVNDFRKKIKKE